MVEIPLINGKGIALIDDEDAERVNAYHWTRHSAGYAQRKARGNTVLLHRFVLGAPSGSEVDHANGDRLDCRRSNLRLCNAAQNRSNRLSVASATSPYVGVRRHPECVTRPWMARTSIDGRTVLVGAFVTEIDAAIARDAVVRAIKGEFGVYNFPRPGERSALGGDVAA